MLALRSGNACAYPGCGVSLIIEAQHDADSDKTIGKAAHICAASPGGPRYDHTMTPKERGSASNLIYLCGPHHDAIDTQLNYHTVELLRAAKANHEAAVLRATSYAMGTVGFTELEAVCAAIHVSDRDVQSGNIEVPLEIDEKIHLNRLQGASRQRIMLGLAKVAEVAGFIRWKSSFKADFGTRLAARFRQLYFQGVADGMTGDELYLFICSEALRNAGPIASETVQAAALAVVAYLFTTCEIFEHESPAA